MNKPDMGFLALTADLLQYHRALSTRNYLIALPSSLLISAALRRLLDRILVRAYSRLSDFGT